MSCDKQSIGRTAPVRESLGVPTGSPSRRSYCGKQCRRLASPWFECTEVSDQPGRHREAAVTPIRHLGV